MNESEYTSRYSDYDDVPLFLNCLEVMKLLGLSRTTVYGLFQSKDFPTITVGKRRMVCKEALFQWIESHEKVISENVPEPTLSAHLQAKGI